MAGVEGGNVDFSLPSLRRDQETNKALTRLVFAAPLFAAALAVAFWGITPSDGVHEVVPFKRPKRRYRQ
ncbi:MAG: hypothetical protein V4437_02940 [Patescibacteria group bacterium]